MKSLSYFFAILALFVSLSCCPCRKAGDITRRELASTSWKLAQLNGKGVPAAAADEYTLTFNEDGTLSGKAKCNQIMGGYTLDTKSRTLSLSNMGMTRMMCHETNVEDEYGAMFQSVSHYEVDGQTLVLLGKGESIALFRKL